MTSRWELWVRNWCFPSFMIVQWASNAGGWRVRQGSFCPVQLISLTIIPQVGGRGVGGHSTTFYKYREVPPLGRTPYTFIVKGARLACLGVEPPRTNFNITQILGTIHLVTITLTESRISLSTGCPSRLLVLAVDLHCGKSRTSITQCALFITIVLGWKVCQW